MEKPVYTQPSIYLTVEEQIAANDAYLVQLKAWEAAQTEETE